MASSLYRLVFAKELNQRKIEHIVDKILIKHGMQVEYKRKRFPKEGITPAYSDITYNSWGIETLVHIMIPKFPQSQEGYTVPVVFTYYGSTGGSTTSDYLVSLGKKPLSSSEEIRKALEEACYKNYQSKP